MKHKFYHLTLLLVFIATIDYRFFAYTEDILSFTVIDIFVYSIGLLYLFNALVYKSILNIGYPKVYQENRYVFWYFGWALGSATVAMIYRSSYDVLSIFKEFIPSIIIYMFLVTYIKDEKQVNNVLIMYILGSAIGLILGLSQGLTGGPHIVEENWAFRWKMDPSGKIVSGNIVRGWFSHPNGFAAYNIPIVIICFSSIFIGFFKYELFILLFPILLFTITLTYAKGAWFWMLIGITLIYLPRKLDNKRFIIGLFVYVTSIASLIIGSVIYSSSFESLGTVLGRMQLLVAGFYAMLSDKYIFLFGDGIAAVQPYSTIYSNTEYPNMHSGILNLILYYGIPALILYILIIITSLKRLSYLINIESKFKRAVGVFLFSSLISINGNLFFEPHMASSLFQAQIFIFIALTTVITRDNTKKRGYYK